jgi:D-3-phosphoglycerate dehydrogenase
MRVLVTCRQMQNNIELFRRQFDERNIEIDMPTVVQQPSEEDLMAIIGNYDGMIAGDDPLTSRVLEKAERMRVISKWGVGVDGIDLERARELGITVTNTPGVFGDDVADVAAGYMVMLARQLHRIHESVRDGGWWKHEGRVLAGSTLGIAGFGSIGRAVARRGWGFGMSVVAHDPDANAFDSEEVGGVEAVSRDDLFRRSDFLVLCTPLSEHTRHMVDNRAFEQMRDGSFLVNVARGQLVDEPALVAALESGRIAAAALDVFEEEPLPAGSSLRAFPQCVFGSHNASNTAEGVVRASALAVDNLMAGLEKT